MGSIAWTPPPIAWDYNEKGIGYHNACHAALALSSSSSVVGNSTKSNAKVYLAYDGRMTLHKPISTEMQEEIMEKPERVRVIYERLKSMPQAQYKFLELPCLPASRDAITLVHSSDHYEQLGETAYMSDDELEALTIPDDLYYGRDTFFAARMAVGGVLECTKAVTSPCRSSSTAIAVVRPPGHHAVEDQAMGTFHSIVLCILVYVWWTVNFLIL